MAFLYNVWLLSDTVGMIKVYYVSSGVKANCNSETVEAGVQQNISAKSIIVKYLSVADEMGSVISIMGQSTELR